MRVVTADGRITRAGGNVVKNVAGFDLCKLYVGSLGTLGVIVEATFKLSPEPLTRGTMALTFQGPYNACDAAIAIRERGLAIQALQLIGVHGSGSDEAVKYGDYVLLLDLGGSPSAVQRSSREIFRDFAPATVLADELTVKLSDYARIGGSPWGGPLVCRASVLPSHLADLITEIDSPPAKPWVVAYPTIGVVRFGWLRPHLNLATIERLRDAVRGRAGSLVIERCPPALKRQIDVFGEIPPKTLDLMRRIKHQFDPNGILSPGRFVGKL
jgi:glycolate oxidase FAD binding subunit